MIVKTLRTFVSSSRFHTTLPAQPSSAVWTCRQQSRVFCSLIESDKMGIMQICVAIVRSSPLCCRERERRGWGLSTVTLEHAAVQEGTMGAGLQVSPHWSTRGHVTASSPLIGPGSRARPRRITSGCRRRTCPSCGRGRSCAGRSTSPWIPSPGACQLENIALAEISLSFTSGMNFSNFLFYH